MTMWALHWIAIFFDSMRAMTVAVVTAIVLAMLIPPFGGRLVVHIVALACWCITVVRWSVRRQLGIPSIRETDKSIAAIPNRRHSAGGVRAVGDKKRDH
ncbi:hypothetical protein [Nonomuraea sp. NPDC049400]|uniref:hypothetical protein n=1 Tax=Nonomuraea sp. NPDC049400 TaxID=3364352 RepID=UPI00379C461F